VHRPRPTAPRSPDIFPVEILATRLSFFQLQLRFLSPVGIVSQGPSPIFFRLLPFFLPLQSTTSAAVNFFLSSGFNSPRRSDGSYPPASPSSVGLPSLFPLPNRLFLPFLLSVQFSRHLLCLLFSVPKVLRPPDFFFLRSLLYPPLSPHPTFAPSPSLPPSLVFPLLVSIFFPPPLFPSPPP